MASLTWYSILLNTHHLALLVCTGIYNTNNCIDPYTSGKNHRSSQVSFQGVILLTAVNQI